MNIAEAFENTYKGGLEILVSFNKKDGSEREMTVKRNRELEARCVGGRSFIGTDQLHVVELGPLGPQWRTVNLDRINHFTVINR